MKAIRYIILTVLATSLLCCKLLQKNKDVMKTHAENEELNLVDQRNTLNRKSEFFLVDSSHQNFTLQLWPKGKFTFSATKGFEGEAERMILVGKQTSQKQWTAKEETQLDSSRIEAKYNHLKETTTLVKKSTFSIGYNWAWLLLIPGFYIVYLGYKRVLRFI